MKHFKLSAFVLGIVLLLQGISPANAVTVSKYGPKLVELLLSPDGLQRSYLVVPAFLKRFSKEYFNGKATDLLVKSTYNALIQYLVKLFPDKPKRKK